MKGIINKELIIKVLILIVLILLIGITSFRSGTKFYLLKNMYLDDNTSAEIKSRINRWDFKARIIYNNEINNNREKDNL